MNIKRPTIINKIEQTLSRHNKETAKLLAQQAVYSDTLGKLMAKHALLKGLRVEVHVAKLHYSSPHAYNAYEYTLDFKSVRTLKRRLKKVDPTGQYTRIGHVLIPGGFRTQIQLVGGIFDGEGTGVRIVTIDYGTPTSSEMALFLARTGMCIDLNNFWEERKALDNYIRGF